MEEIITQCQRIGICAPSRALKREHAERVIALAAESHPHAELIFVEQCFAEAGHFAGEDSLRRDAFVSMANDPDLDAIWFARGGYGAARIAEDIVAALEATANDKLYMGYSDGGNLLGTLYRAGIGKPVHGPMPIDITRNDGDTAVQRALDWFTNADSSTLEPHIQAGQKYVAFNLMTLAMMAGTRLMPDLSDHILMIEDLGEYHYAIDRAMFSVTNHLKGTGVSGIRMGRFSDIPENDRPFGETVEQIICRWCEYSEIPYLGGADIGHDVGNKVIPFGISI